eukprot:GABV01003791.1.p1 GENE.GABV01003791.1~~GABV01003791.1.p1  ORF type:complete len:128 (-),score=36.79 GABV01003791.1:21-404(-)
MADAKTPEKFDLLVIGAGSGGLGCGRRAAEYGAKVAVFEHGRIGGTCVNVGCVPKKVMFLAAHVADTLKDAHGYGFDHDAKEVSDSFNWARLKEKRDAYITRLNGIYDTNVNKAGFVQLHPPCELVF